MTTADYLALRRGTDVFGIATALTENQQVTLTEEAVQHIAKSFCVWLITHTGKTKVSVAIGYDARLSSPILCEAVVEGILSTGHDAVVTDLSSTPSMRMLLQDDAWLEKYPCDGSIMITAGHLPKQYNGMKFFFGDHTLLAEDVESILDMAGHYRYAEPSTPGQRIEISYMSEYASRLVQLVRQETGEEMPLLNHKIIVEAGNGVGGFFVDNVLIPLGADTEGSQNLNADGNFPNYIPYPENSVAIANLAKAVITTKAHLGILLSADADCVGAVAKGGKPLNRNHWIALMSAILLAEKPGTIVTDSLTSDGLTKFIESHGGTHHRFIRGQQNLIHEALRLNGLDEYTPLAIDTSGHVAMLENDFRNDSVYSIARLLITHIKATKEGTTLTDLIQDLQQPKERMEVHLPIQVVEDTQLDATRVICEYAAYAERTPYATPAEDTCEGSRVNYDEQHGNGWAMLCANVDENVLPLCIESDSEHGALKIAKDVYYFLKNSPYVDVAPLKEAIDQERQRLLGLIKQDFYSDAAYLTFLFGEKTVLQNEEIEEFYKKDEVVEEAAESTEEVAEEAVEETQTTDEPVAEEATEEIASEEDAVEAPTEEEPTEAVAQPVEE